LVEWKKPGAGRDSAVLELYDYQDDPGENKNLADDKPEVVKELRAILNKQPEAKPQIHPGGAAKKLKAKRKDGKGKPALRELAPGQ
jgi:hypothetical protein